VEGDCVGGNSVEEVEDVALDCGVDYLVKKRDLSAFPFLASFEYSSFGFPRTYSRGKAVNATARPTSLVSYFVVGVGLEKR